MKLNNKFSIIVGITALQIFSLTVFLFMGSRQMLAIKEYQFLQAKVAMGLSDLIIYIDDVDNGACQPSTAYREWNEKLTGLDGDFNSLLNEENVAKFDDDFKQSVSELKTLWEMLKIRFEPVENILKDMQEIKVDLGITTHTAADGIRVTYALFPDNPAVAKLMEYVEKIHGEQKGIKRSYLSIKKINNKTAIQLENFLAGRQTHFMIVATIFATLSTLILVFLISFVTRGITKRIKKIRDTTSILAEKDFTVKVVPEGSEELHSLMTNLNEMVEQINRFFVIVKTTASKAISSGYSINDAANSTAAATSEIDENIKNITGQFNTIKESVKRTVDAIAEMNVQVETLVVNNDRQFAAIEDSNNSVKQVVETLEYINSMAAKRTKNAEEMHNLVAAGDEKIATTNDLLHRITEQLDEIQEVVTIIDNVAEQTNLLSMNAAIESAHAGEAGKGFSVVAEEIRNLAEETSENASRIGMVISDIVASVKDCNKSSAEASEAFEIVSEHSDKVIESFLEISSGIQKIDEQMRQIKVKSEETSTAANQINSYCQSLADKQKIVSTEVDSMNQEFVYALTEINHIKSGTEDIVDRMQNVSEASKLSYKNMTDLENVLEEFKTASEVEDAVQKADSDNSITKVVSDELMKFADADSGSKIKNREEVVFDLEAVEDYNS